MINPRTKTLNQPVRVSLPPPKTDINLTDLAVAQCGADNHGSDTEVASQLLTSDDGAEESYTAEGSIEKMIAEFENFEPR